MAEVEILLDEVVISSMDMVTFTYQTEKLRVDVHRFNVLNKLCNGNRVELIQYMRAFQYGGIVGCPSLKISKRVVDFLQQRFPLVK